MEFLDNDNYSVEASNSFVSSFSIGEEEFTLTEDASSAKSSMNGFANKSPGNITNFKSSALRVKATITKKTKNNKTPRKKSNTKSKNQTKQDPELSRSFDFFFQSIMSQLNKFSNSEYLEFQVGLLQVIANMYEKRKQNQTAKLYAQEFMNAQTLSQEPHSSCP